MQQSLRKICHLPGDGSQRSEINNFSIIHYLPSELQYAYRYWAQHLIQSKGCDSVLDNTLVFLEKHFLYWVEVISILGVMSEVVGAINRVLQVTQISSYKDQRNYKY